MSSRDYEIVLLRNVLKNVQKANQSATQKNRQDCRDHCIKAQTLMDLHTDSSSRAAEYIHTCAQALKKIIMQLCERNTSKTIEKLPEVRHDDGSGAKNDDTELISSSDQSSLKFSDIIGNTAAKQALFENVVLPLTVSLSTASAIFSGIRSGSGNVLLHGPPGTGKTILAQATAREANAKLFTIHPSSILSKYQGESEKVLKSLFEKCRTEERAIIFFDEFDSIAMARGGSENDMQSRRLLSELLVQMSLNRQIQKQNIAAVGTANPYSIKKTRSSCDEKALSTDVLTMAICSQNTDNHSSTHFSQYKEPMQSSGMGRGLKRDSSLVVHNEHDSTNVVPRVNFTVVLAATNRLEDLDEAVLRRFESKILVDLPESMYREQLFEKFLIGVEHHLTSENFSSLASLTEGWSCSDIETLTREAAMISVRAVYTSLDFDGILDFKVNAIEYQDFVTAHSQLMNQNTPIISEELSH